MQVAVGYSPLGWSPDEPDGFLRLPNLVRPYAYRYHTCLEVK